MYDVMYYGDYTDWQEAIYEASYPCRFFDENRFIKYFEQNNYQLIEKYNSHSGEVNRAIFKGMILKK